MRAISCALLSYLFLKLAKSKIDGGIFMDTADRVWAVIWSTLFYISVIISIVLCILGL